MTAEDWFKVDRMEVSYGASQVLFGVSLRVAKGATAALLGRNGAGKSTTFKAIAGLVPPRAGRVVLDGRDIAGMPPYRIARMGVGYVPEDRQVFPDHSVEDNLQIAEKRGPHGETHWTIQRIYEIFPTLETLRRRYAGRLSGGEQQMLTIARTSMGNPEIVLLDEPSEGLAPVIVVQIQQLLRRLSELGTTILLAEQNLNFCLAVATDVMIIEKGHIVYRDTPENLQRDNAIKRRYLAV